MATAGALLESLETFADLFNENPDLKQMLRDWNRIALVSPSDLPERFTLRVEGGSCTLHDGSPPQYHLEIAGTSDLLTSMFTGEVSPTEPYLDGRLICRGSEEDLMKLDFVTAMIWE